MNYRHAFHAGNFADVLKHTVLCLALARLMLKAKPLRVIDTHAGIGRYRLDAPEALRTGEWRGGIGRLFGPEADVLPAPIAELLAPYLAVVAAQNPDGSLIVYPGSPVLALALMRAEDRLIATELHPEDAGLLRLALKGERRAKVLEMDGWQAVRALLPPKERRGLVLIDPPFEEAGEHERLLTGLGDGVRRFATGTYLLWLPIKSRKDVAPLERSLAELALDDLLWVELRTETPETAERLAATALVVLNPPYGLEEQLRRLLPFLADRLATGPGHGWRLERLEPRRSRP